MLRCPVCGCEINPLYLKFDAEKQIEVIDGVEVIKYKCSDCNTFISPITLKHDFQYYNDKAEEIYGSRWRDEIVILDEIKEYGLFDEEKYKQSSNIQSARCKEYLQKNQQSNKNQPKCPTCQSTNISKISTTSKVAGAAMFGLFSKTARSQFCCNNCGYKW